MPVVRVVVAGIAAIAIGRTLLSAVNTFVVPRAAPVRLTRVIFALSRRFFMLLTHRRSVEARHRVLSLFPAITLLVLPAVWLVITMAGFTALQWAVEPDGWRRSLEISGSSLLTLGFARPDSVAANLLTFIEASLGIALLALLITYLPTIYAAYLRREVNVGLLEVRAGRPPTAVEMLRRFHAIGMLHDTADMWANWELWFVELEETHTSHGSLALFRSDRSDVSWVVAAGAVLDGAALMLSTVQVPWPHHAALCIRSGFLSLRRIAQFYGLPFPESPRATDPISITRAEFDAACDELRAAGIQLQPDREQAWSDFAGWRVNYDVPLLRLAALTASPPARWTSDRPAPA